MKKKKNKEPYNSLLKVYVSTMHMAERERQNIERALNRHNCQFSERPLYHLFKLPSDYSVDIYS